ncbi:hypothetical protein [Rhodoferax mekongensis]|uniref:Uncharacterized protein n=1 Tax=Rhodoferax mekongensis TaxID=3068341 RepID=A0ABZ0B2A3_9BURK|nr:hypothetical protein [Rhodoferax sp. TBRC 17307]WNO06021.1 hypothetical protein RAN89_06215 [Rhodoferax sp. TBRC 17307]
MNHIHKLQNENRELNDQVLRKNERIAEFRAHLQSPKFHAVQGDGERGDWISTGDVQRWLLYIEDLGRMYP